MVALRLFSTFTARLPGISLAPFVDSLCCPFTILELFSSFFAAGLLTLFTASFTCSCCCSSSFQIAICGLDASSTAFSSLPFVFAALLPTISVASSSRLMSL